MSKTVVQRSSQERVYLDVQFWISLILLGIGAAALLTPHLVYTIIVNIAVAVSIFIGVVELFRFFRDRSRMALVRGLLGLALGLVLVFNDLIPEWIIRVSFGLYCTLIASSQLIQIVIYSINETPVSVTSVVICIVDFGLAFLVLFTPDVSTDMLLRVFGCYFLILGFRYWSDMLDARSKNYRWKRSFRISMPVFLSVILPDYVISRLRKEKEIPDVAEFEDLEIGDTSSKLSVMVHVGPEGMQKVGHFSFVYDGLVYSYGNYDAESEKMFGLMGDGVFFVVPYEDYIPDLLKYEKNTLFEYFLDYSPIQQEIIEARLSDLNDNAYRWYCTLEKAQEYPEFEKYEKDYPNRLHYRTGAKFYKLKKGKYKTYWATGNNCVIFSEIVLGTVGADIISLKGIVAPGSYYDFLETELGKANSPVVGRKIHILDENIVHYEEKDEQKETEDSKTEQKS